MVVSFYAWTNRVESNAWHIGGPQTDYYNLLLHGFLKGHLYMDAPVAEELKACPDPWNPAVRGPQCPIMQDATYYDGHYYLYYGVGPLVSLLLPFRLLTGSDLPISLATFCFACGGLLVSLVLWQHIKERYFAEVSAYVGWAAVLILGITNLVPVLLRRTLVYELPIASGYFFSMFALLAIYLCMHSEKRRYLWMAAASLSLGFAVASRLTYLFTMPILLFPAFWDWRRGSMRKFAISSIRLVAAAVLPIGAVGVAMAIYNYQRYGSFTEFGTSYQVAEMFYLAKMQNFGVGHVPFNFVNYLFAPLDMSRYYPFFMLPGTWNWPVRPPADYFGPELVPGFLLCFPIGILASLSIFAARGRSKEDRDLLQAWLYALWGLLAGCFGCLLVFHAGIVRYMLDFTPAFMVCAAVGLLVLEKQLRNWSRIVYRVLVRSIWGCVLCFSVAAALFCSIELHGVFQSLDPIGHAKVAHFFNRLSFWNVRLDGDKAGPVEITIQPDRGLAGRVDPVFACGAGSASERIFLRWLDGSRVVIGYQYGLSSENSKLSRPINISIGKKHKVYIDLDSFYYEQNSSSKDAVERENRWIVGFDGKPVLKGTSNYGTSVPDASLIFVGSDPSTHQYGKYAKTPIVSARRLINSSDFFSGFSDRSSVGLEFRMPMKMTRERETILAVTDLESTLKVDVQYLSGGLARFILSIDRKDMAQSESFCVKEQWYALDLIQTFEAQAGKIQLLINKVPAMKLSGNSVDMRFSEVSPGWSGGAAGFGSAFTGIIRNVESDGALPIRPVPFGDKIAMTLVFPSDRKGKSEPLLVTGRTGVADLYDVVYVDDRHVQFRIDHWGIGFTRTSPLIELDYKKSHDVVFRFLCGDPSSSIRQGSVQLSVDGRDVWAEPFSFYAFAEEDIRFGLNEIGGTNCETEFTGRILACER